MNRFNKKRNIYITIAIITILLIGLGYAFLTSNLNIIGNTNINKNTWGVEFENVQVAEGSVEASTPTISNKTAVNYTVTLDKPGDYYEFAVDAVNKGSIDAMIDSVSNTGLTTDQKKYLEYTATYTSGKELAKKQELKSNQTQKIQVRVEYKKDITAEDLPSENEQLTLTLTIEYVQADDSSEEVVHPVCKRATKLHTETCTNTDSYACLSSYGQGDTITYGSLGTSGTLASGNAFDCDVNGDGSYNSETERFYYISDLDTDSNYGVLIYYNNVSGGEPNKTKGYPYDPKLKPRENGPVTLLPQLPSTSQWKNVSLSNTTRKIKDELGNEYTDFSYEGRAARLITYQEVVSVCGNGAVYDRGYLDSCKYLLENTRYSNNSLREGYWLENPRSSYSAYAWLVYGQYNMLYANTTTWNNSAGVRPAIEVPKSKISY